MYSSDWKLNDEEIVGAENIYHILKENLNKKNKTYKRWKC